MAIDEASRHRMYQRLEEVLGAEEATTLMEHLPPTGWGDVARKSDLDHLAVATKHDLEQLELRLDARFEARLERALREQTFRFLTYVTGLVTVIAGIALAIARLT